MSTLLKWEEPKEFTLKKHKEKPFFTRKVIINHIIVGLFISGIFMLSWYLSQIQEHKRNVPLWMALIIAISLSFLMTVVLPALEAKSQPSKLRVKITNKAVVLKQLNSNESWCFSNIAEFRTDKEQIDESVVNTIFLRDFNGRSNTIGIPSQMSLDPITAILSDKIRLSREIIKNSITDTTKDWGNITGFILIILGSLLLFLIFMTFFNLNNHEKDLSFMRDDIEEAKSQFASGNPAPLQEKAFGKVVVKAYSARYSISKITDLQVRSLFGAIAIAVILFGLNLMLWARSRRLFNRMRKLEIMYLELLNSQNKVQSD
jgi:hypothetical protein